MIPQAPARIGAYRIVTTLGRGGTGSVYRAEREGQRYAIKCLHDHVLAEPELRARFVREARLTASLEHPNLVQVVEIAEDAIVGPYLVMEELRGVTLARVLDADPRLPLPIAAAILSAFLRALAALHGLAAGSVVHGDLSPQNLVIGFDGRVKLIDLGLARADHATRVTRVDTLRGKLRYLAPEQLQASPRPTVATDLYAASVVAWELFTGRPLIDGAANRQRIASILAGAHRPPSIHRPELAPAVDTAILRGLSGLPSTRFDSVAALHAAVVPVLGPEATEGEVGDHVRALFPDAAAATDPEPLATDTEIVPTPRSRGRFVVPALVAAAVATCTLGFVVWPRSARVQVVAVEPAPVVSGRSHTTPVAAASSAAMEPGTVAAPVGSPVPSASPPTSRPPAPHRVPRAAGSCASPFSFDASGNKTYRPGCL